MRARLRDARTRVTPTIKITARCGWQLCSWRRAAGSIYNTNILNDYQTPKSRLDVQADYERRMRGYKKLPQASPVDIAMEVDLYPQERTPGLARPHDLAEPAEVALDKAVVSVDPRLAFERWKWRAARRPCRTRSTGFHVST